MIIKRVEKDEKVKAIYKSSNILASTYDKTNSNLTVIFNNGGQYTYLGVKNTDYLRFETEESQGKVLNSHIKQYPFEKGENVDTSKILAEVRLIEETAVKSMAEYVVENMKAIVDAHSLSGELNDTMMKALNAAIIKYNEIKG